MFSRRDYGIFFGALVLTAASVTAGVLLSGIWERPHAREEALGILSAQLVVPLVILAIVLVALLSVDAGKARPAKGELDRLVQLKRRGRLLHSYRRKHRPINAPPAACPEGILAHRTATKRASERT